MWKDEAGNREYRKDEEMKLTVEKAMECTVLHLKSKNDINGNPRRLFLVMHPNGMVAAVDEGYVETSALNVFESEVSAILRARIVGAIEIKPKQYRELLRQENLKVTRE